MLKKIKLILLMTTMAAIIGACTGEDGEIGPAGEQGVEGEQGDKGDKGDQGEAGAPGEGELEEVGSLTGTISGTRRDGVAFNKEFSYPYTYGKVLNFFNDENGANQFRIDRTSGTEFNDYFEIYLKLEDGTLKPLRADYSTFISYKTEENPTTLFSLTAVAYYEESEGVPSDEFVVSNYNHDATTGVLSFDFTINISGNAVGLRENSTEHDLLIQGSYNSGVKVYANTVGKIKNN